MKRDSLPDRTDLPFLGYWVFAEKGLVFPLIECFVTSSNDVRIPGILKSDNDIKVASIRSPGEIKCQKITFDSKRSSEAYETLAKLELAKFFQWEQISLPSGEYANILAERDKKVNKMDIRLPFFAYGLFRPKELCFYRIESYIASQQDASVQGLLYERDGTPLLANSKSESDRTNGTLIFFEEGRARKAYEEIDEIEPERSYRWGEVEVETDEGKEKANVLLGKSPEKGGGILSTTPWSGRDDPYFSTALDLIYQDVQQYSSNGFKPEHLLRLQMSYLMLWTSIERFNTLRYSFKAGPVSNNALLASDPLFKRHLERAVPPQEGGSRFVYRADKAASSSKVQFSRNDPKKAIDYYYQLRSNAVHRGKGVERDQGKISEALNELLLIFCGVLQDVWGRERAPDIVNIIVDSRSESQLIG